MSEQLPAVPPAGPDAGPALRPDADPAAGEPGAAALPPAASFTRSHPTLVYTVSRILLFLVVFGLLYLVGARDFVLIVLAFFISGAISLVLLSRQRDAMSSSVTGTFSRINERIEESKRAEDVD